MAVIELRDPTVEFDEVTLDFQSPQETLGEEGLRATQIFRVDWADRLTLANQLRTAFRIQLVNGRVFYIGQPYVHDRSLFVREISSITPEGKPQDAGGGVAKYKKALLTVQYEPLDFDPSDNDDATIKYLEEELGVSAEFLTLDGTGLEWASDSEPVETGVNIAKMIRMTEWVVTWTEIRETLPIALLTKAGTVNDATVTSRTLGLTFDEGTLLYMGPRIRSTLFVDGSRATQLTVSFVHRPSGWNNFFRPGVQAAEAIQDAAAMTFEPYELFDFTNLGI